MFYSLKQLHRGKKRVSGRCNSGRVSIRHRGGGHKRSYHFVDFFRSIKKNYFFRVCGFKYDPNRTAFVAVLVSSSSKLGGKTEFHCILQPKGLVLDDFISNFSFQNFSNFLVGSSYPLSRIPVGGIIHNVEFHSKNGGQVARAAGSFSQVIQKEKKVLLKLPSGQTAFFNSASRCVFGSVGNEQHKLVRLVKAGRSRWLGRRPSTRGVAINTNDHPHGGGEGKSQVGRHPVSPWGKLTKGKKTKKQNASLPKKKSKDSFAYSR